MTNFTELNSKEMNRVNGGSASVILGPAIAPLLVYTLIRRLAK